MKFDYSFNLSEWFNGKSGLICSLIIEILLVISVLIEMYAGESNLVLMLLLLAYLIDSGADNYYKLKELKGK